MKTTTFRLSLCALLIFGITAKPYVPLGKYVNEENQEAVSKYDTKKEHVEVEPQDINPSGDMQKNMVAKVVLTAQNEAPLKAVKVSKVLDVDSAFTEVHSEDPEQDWDHLNHKDVKEMLQYLAPMRAAYRVNPLYSEPEKDEDEVYHGDNQYSEVQTDNEQKASEDSSVRGYLQPEEDKDDLYHKDVQLLLQSDPREAAPVHVAFQRKHSEPEEDLDDLYHS